MANPTPYERGYSFSGFQANNPQKPLPGPKVDEELDNIERTTTDLISGLSDLRRSDGQLKNGIVTLDSLSPEVSTGVQPAVPWATATQYEPGAVAFYNTGFYRALVSHVSGVFATDLAAGYWLLFADLAPIVVDAGIARDEAILARDASEAARDASEAARDASEAARDVAQASATTATGAASTAASAATSAATSYDLFDDRYLGEKTSLPTLDNDGNALVNGAIVSLTGQVDPNNDGMYVRRSGAWAPMFAPTNVLAAFQRYSSADGNLTAGQTVFTVSAGYIPTYASVFRNGAKLVNGVEVMVADGATFTLATGAGATDVIEFQGFRVYNIVDLATAAVEYASRAALAAAVVSPGTLGARLLGYATPGDGGGGDYVRLGAAPSPSKAWHVQSADGTWFELRENVARAKQFGAKGDDATDDSVALQAWSDYLAAFGARGRLTKGVYRVPSASITFANDVMVDGEGDQSVVKRTTDVAAPLFLASGKDRVAFRDITFATTAGTTSTTSNTIGTGSKSFTIPAGLSFVNGDIVVAIQTSNSANYMYGAVTSYSGTTLTINMATAVGSGTITDWTIGQNNGANVACRAINCTNVLMSRLKVTGLFYVGLEQQNCNGGRVIDNEISGVINRPIYVYAASGATDDIVVRDNLIMGNSFTMYGVNLNGSTGGTITDVTISGNQIEGTRFQAIDIAGGCVSVSVTGNNVANLASTATGILIQKANGLVPYGNTVSGNTVRDTGTGVYVLDAYYNTVSGNSISACGTGIRQSQTSGNTCQYNNVIGNNVSACTSLGITYDAVTAGLCGASSCTGNVIIGPGGTATGIFTTTNTDRIAFAGNISLNNGGGNASKNGTNHTTSGDIVS